ncbi:MAG: hypothetical protein ACI8VW_000294, partial [bacterium]
PTPIGESHSRLVRRLIVCNALISYKGRKIW